MNRLPNHQARKKTINPGDKRKGFRPLRFGLLLILLLLSNSVLSYAAVPPAVKFWVFLLGVLLPVYGLAAERTGGRKGKAPFYRVEFLPDLPGWPWGLLLAAGFLLRFWRITRLFAWPMGDEGLSGDAALALSRHWNWDFFYSVGQAPPLLDWVCGLFFKFSRDPFLNLWVPSALFSCATLVLGLIAARRYFSKSLAFLVTGLLAFSYWPLYLGRFCLQAVLVPSVELLSLWMLGRFLEATEGPRKVRAAWALGIVTGLNVFTFTTWPLMVVLVGMAVYLHSFGGRRKESGIFFRFSAGLFLALIPFLVAAFRQGYGQHIRDVAVWSRPLDAANLLQVAGGYLAVLGWGVAPGQGFYVPARGGFLNPLLTSFFFLGLARAWRHASLPRVQWVLFAGFLFLVPGFLSLNVEGFRVVQILPLLLLLSAWGLEPLLPASRKAAVLVVAGLFLLTAVFDFARMAQPYRNIAGNPGLFLSTGKTLSRYRAYQVLKDLKTQGGPGWILSEWDLPADHTLAVMTSGFNATLDPGPAGGSPRWLAVMADAHYRPFLQKRFPHAQWWELDSDLPRGGDRMLGVIPVEKSDASTLERWARADRAFRDINWGTDHLYDKDCLETVDRRIREDYPLVQGDRFLESAFWEKVAQFYYYYGHHYAEHLRASQLAVERGYPAAQLYGKLSELYRIGGREGPAARALGLARRSEIKNPWR